ncbi:hypothetical protein GDO81_005649 [Engystomops pustulosus]|uniref:Olfactory receptor n=1 Tax=Engystomops pustulosus TaxID=76066 RepID=A0AAV7CQJ9_ENGPU|nr:hypothetical protein GDO81_005649 [Engystomops pustulosus]
MDYGNQTLFTELILVGLTQNLRARISLSFLFLFLYIMIILGNGFLIFTIIVSPQLHTPMYYFLCNLSIIDLCFTTCNVPKLLHDTFFNTGIISVVGCLTQMILGLFLGITECILLAVMAYDRYIAICSPLRYTLIMSWRVCNCTTVIMWGVSLILALIPIIMKPFVFCKGNILNHVACEILVVMELACGDLSSLEMQMFFQSFFILVTPLVFIVVSYICIIASLLHISSALSRSKAFSTCASHLTVVIMFYGGSITMYMGQARFSHNLKYISLTYGFVTPTMNPFIYSLRNNEVKEAFKKVSSRYFMKTNIGDR